MYQDFLAICALCGGFLFMASASFLKTYIPIRLAEWRLKRQHERQIALTNAINGQVDILLRDPVLAEKFHRALAFRLGKGPRPPELLEGALPVCD